MNGMEKAMGSAFHSSTTPVDRLRTHSKWIAVYLRAQTVAALPY